MSDDGLSRALYMGAMHNENLARLNESYVRGRLDNAQQDVASLKKENQQLRDENSSLRSKLSMLTGRPEELLVNENLALRSELGKKDVELARSKALLKDWMVSQTAFRNLFKKYGKLPDGRTPTDLTKDEQIKLVEEEEKAILESEQLSKMK